jgi:hypothetical protein
MNAAYVVSLAGMGGAILTLGMVILHLYTGHRKASQ